MTIYEGDIGWTKGDDSLTAIKVPVETINDPSKTRRPFQKNSDPLNFHNLELYTRTTHSVSGPGSFISCNGFLYW
jgi:hypothetical protein